jgi:hypothetical protein
VNDDILAGEEWQSRIGDMIVSADTIVFLVSPDSASSTMCAWEIEHAYSFGKRVIPVLVQDTDLITLPSRIRDLNFVFMHGAAEFAPGMASLIEALSTDLDWLREHTRLLQRATEWVNGGRPDNRLLSGADIGLANAWIARRPQSAPDPTELHRDYILNSEQVERRRNDVERQRLEQMAAAQSERARALEEMEFAQKQAAVVARRVVRRTLAGLVAALALAAIAIGTGVYARMQSREAEKRAALVDYLETTLRLCEEKSYRDLHYLDCIGIKP